MFDQGVVYVQPAGFQRGEAIERDGNLSGLFFAAGQGMRGEGGKGGCGGEGDVEVGMGGIGAEIGSFGGGGLLHSLCGYCGGRRHGRRGGLRCSERGGMSRAAVQRALGYDVCVCVCVCVCKSARRISRRDPRGTLAGRGVRGSGSVVDTDRNERVVGMAVMAARRDAACMWGRNLRQESARAIVQNIHGAGGERKDGRAEGCAADAAPPDRSALLVHHRKGRKRLKARPRRGETATARRGAVQSGRRGRETERVEASCGPYVVNIRAFASCYWLMVGRACATQRRVDARRRTSRVVATQKGWRRSIAPVWSAASRSPCAHHNCCNCA